MANSPEFLNQPGPPTRPQLVKANPRMAQVIKPFCAILKLNRKKNSKNR